MKTSTTYNAKSVSIMLQAIISAYGIPLNGTISPKTGKHVTAFGHESASTQGIVDNCLIFGNILGLTDLFLTAGKHEIAIKRSEYCMNAAISRGATLAGHFAGKAIEKVQGKITFLGNSRPRFRSSFLVSFPGQEKAWEAINNSLSFLVPLAKAQGKELRKHAETTRHCLTVSEVFSSLEKLEKTYNKAHSVELAWAEKDREKNLEIEIAWANHVKGLE